MSYSVFLCNCLDREWSIELLSALRFDQNALILNSPGEVRPAFGRHDSRPGGPQRRTSGPETGPTLLCQTSVVDWTISFFGTFQQDAVPKAKLVLSSHMLDVDLDFHGVKQLLLLANTRSADQSPFRIDIRLTPALHRKLRLAGINPIRLFLLRENSVLAVAMQTAPVDFVANVSSLYVDYDGTLVNHQGPVRELFQALRISWERYGWDLYVVTRNLGDLSVGLDALVKSGLRPVELFRVDFHESKAQYVGRHQSAFIDNEFRERRDVWRAGVAALDVDAAIDILSES